MHKEKPVAAVPYTMIPHNIAAYLQEEQNRGAFESAIRHCRCLTSFLYEWLPDDKLEDAVKARAREKHLSRWILLLCWTSTKNSIRTILPYPTGLK